MSTFAKLTLNTDGSVATNETQSIGQAAIAAVVSPLDLLTAESTEFVSRKQAGLNTVIGLGAGMLIQGFFRLLPINPVR